MVTSFQRTWGCTVVFSDPDPAAGHCLPTPLPETPGHSQVNLAQSLLGSLPLSPGSWCAQGFICALVESVSLALWKFCDQILRASKTKQPAGCQTLFPIARQEKLLCVLELSTQCKNLFDIIVLQFVGHLLGGSMLGLVVTSFKRAYVTCCVTQVCCTQSPCPCSRSLLTLVSTGDT